MLRKCNPGSRVFWEVGSDGRFRHCFVSFGETISAYIMSSLRPIVDIDSTHLKGKSKGVLFIASINDENKQLFPLTYGVAPKENDELWGWFLSKFWLAFGEAGHCSLFLISTSLLLMLSEGR